MFVYIQISLLLLIPLRCCGCSKELESNTIQHTGIKSYEFMYNAVPALVVSILYITVRCKSRIAVSITLLLRILI
jgi:hypothetical protein